MNDQRTARSRTGEHNRPGRPERSAGGFQSVLRHDLPASVVVFLVAVPLSLGIAAASGVPLMAGLIAAVVGGIVAGALSGSPLMVSGPAAGLITLVGTMVADFGWPATAAIVAMAGLVQLAFGLVRLGRLALCLSPAVVRGMVAGIGITIAVGQFRVSLGGASSTSVLENLRNLPAELLAFRFQPVLVAAIAVAVLLLWPKVPRASIVPAPLAAVLSATVVTVIFDMDVKRIDLPANPFSDAVLPAVPKGGFLGIATAVVTVAVVASIESLLSAVATDKLHDGARSDLDRELVAQGAANMVSGALGGLPVTGVIVRSTTNVAAGARTRMSGVLHGVWVALFALVFAGMLEMIPMAGLAGLLLVVGFKLVGVKHIRTLWQHRELPAYAVTALGVVFLNLMEGVLLGVAVAALGALYRLTHYAVRIDHDQDDWRVTVHGSLVFLGVGRLLRELRRIPRGDRVTLELHVDLMDHAAFEALDDWRVGYERLGGIVEVDEVHDSWYARAVRGKPGLRKTLPGPLPRWFAPWSHWQQITDHTDTDSPAQAPAVPEARQQDADPMLLGMREFQRRSAHLVRPFLSELAARGQRPSQLFITCADSRVVPNLITSSGPGDLFCLRNIGNLVPRCDAVAQPGHGLPAGETSVGAAVEYAVDVLGVSRITVCGHSHCGAVAAMLGGSARPGSHLHSWLHHGQPSLRRFYDIEARNAVEPGSDELAGAEQLAVANVAQQLDNLLTYPSVRAGVAEGRLELVGMYFDISDARVYLVNAERAVLEPVHDPAVDGARAET